MFLRNAVICLPNDIALHPETPITSSVVSCTTGRTFYHVIVRQLSTGALWYTKLQFAVNSELFFFYSEVNRTLFHRNFLADAGCLYDKSSLFRNTIKWAHRILCSAPFSLLDTENPGSWKWHQNVQGVFHNFWTLSLEGNSFEVCDMLKEIRIEFNNCPTECDLLSLLHF